MATIIEDLEAYREIGLAEQRRLNDLPNPEDEFEQSFLVSQLDDLLPEHLGRLSVLMTSPNLLVLDENQQFLALGNMQATGVFLGAQIVQFDDEEVNVCVSLINPVVDVIGDVKGDPINPTYVIGCMSNSVFFVSSDFFGSGDDSKDNTDDILVDEFVFGLADVEEDIDIALLNGEIDLSELVRIFEDPEVIPEGLPLAYLIDKLNRTLKPEEFTWHITTEQLFAHDRETQEFHSTIDGSQEISTIFKGDVSVNVVITGEGRRIIDLEYIVGDPDTNSSMKMMVPLSSITDLVIKK